MVFNDVWSFLVGNDVNTLYFSDGYGVKKINTRELVGESQAAIGVILDKDTIPNIYNDVSSIYGNMTDNTFCLALSYDHDSYGTLVIKNEVEKEVYSDGYNTYKAQVTDDGKMYLMNKDQNTIEVYYGVYNRKGLREPDFIYSSTSTPAILSGDILTLHVVSGVSTKYSNGTRLYVGTTTGVTRIETYDRELIDGYCAGFDHFGVSITYSITGGIGMHKSIGGTISNVTSISSDDEKGVFLVATQDGFGNGGLTQISLSTNKKKIYMTKESNDLPSNTIRDVWGKNGGKN